MSNNSGISYLRDRQGPKMTQPLRPEAIRVRDASISTIAELLQGMFDGIDDSFFELANAARSNSEQNRFFEAMREIRIKRRGIETRYQQQIQSLFERPPITTTGGTTPFEEFTADTLSLVQDDALEEEVAIRSMVTKAKANCQGVLLQVQSRLTTLYTGASEEIPVNPLAPDYIFEAFAKSCDVLDLAIRERLIVLKQFDRFVVTNYELVLDEANRLLVQAGVLPQLRITGRKSKSASPRSAASADSNRQADPQAEEVAADVFFNQLQQLMSVLRSATPNAAGGTGAALSAAGLSPDRVHFLADQELMTLLTTLQHNAPTGDLAAGQPVVVDIRGALKTMLGSMVQSDGKTAALNQVDEDLINLVSMLFEFILEDYNLSAPIQVLISRLQIPILKVVIKDKSFFSKGNHPARRLLNSLAKAGIGWSDADERRRDKLYDKIHEVVVTILNEFDGDIALFERLQDDFDAFLTRESRKATIVEQRTREAERGRLKSQKAQEEVDTALKARMADLVLPEVIRDILQNGWSRVMFLAHLKDETEQRWNQTLRVADDLLWCLQHHHTTEERERWVQTVPSLLKRIRSGLEEVSYNASQLDHSMSELKRVLTEAFQAPQKSFVREREEASQVAGGAESPVDGASGTESAADDPGFNGKTAVQRQKEIEDAALSAFVVRIHALEVGTWVEFCLVNGCKFRCKLSSVIEEAEMYVFVNRMGLKVVEKTRNELAHELRRGRLTMLEQGALIDRAMDTIMANLRRKAS